MHVSADLVPLRLSSVSVTLLRLNLSCLTRFPTIPNDSENARTGTRPRDLEVKGLVLCKLSYGALAPLLLPSSGGLFVM